MSSNGIKDPQLLGVDVELGLYELTDLFHAFYKYHNTDCLVDYDQVMSVNQGSVQTQVNTLSRFQALRRIEAARLGSRPFMSGAGIAKHKPNVSFGYMRLMMDYLALPFKSLFTDSDIVKVRLDKKLYSATKLNKADKEAQKLQEKSNFTTTSNKEIGDDVSDAFANVMRRSKKVRKGFDVVPRRLAQDGMVAFIHSDVDWTPEVIEAIDLVTEPQAQYDPENWGTFFTIRKMTAQEAVSHIREPGAFWNANALRWALESSQDNKGTLTHTHYGRMSSDTKVCGENFAVKSFYSEKSTRQTNIGSYYGNMLVVEGYYRNASGKINKVVFFPSNDFLNISIAERAERSKESVAGGTPRNSGETNDFEFADVLFHRENVFDSMQEAITVIPFDRSELSLERQRAFGHELFSSIEMIMRMDSSILNIAMLIGTPFFKSRNQGNDAQDLLDLEISVNGDMQDLGDRDFVEIPFRGDLNSMMGVRRMLLEHTSAKAYLGGLDGQEQSSTGRGANLANLRLIKDGRIHKHNTEDFAQGLRELFTRMFRRILDLRDKRLTSDDVLLQRTFFDVLTELHGHNDELFEFDKADIVPDTGLPYWMEIEAIRNGASHFGAAELILYSEIKQVFGDGLDQRSLQALNRMGIKSLLGQQDALDILGDPRDLIVTEQDQIYRATMENAAILGSVDQGSLNFEKVMVLNDKDDHVAHLTQVHMTKADEILTRLQENEVTPQQMQEMSENTLETRNTLIIKLGALANHIQLHQQNLERFGSKRDDINQLREQVNVVLQASEGLMNSLQINLRILEQTRSDKEARLRNLTPENEAEKLKQEAELAKLQAQREDAKSKLHLANKIADQRQQQHIDKQLSRARDRQAKERLADKERDAKAVLAQTNNNDNKTTP